MDFTDWDVIILGGGAAGLSAALVLGRARRRVLVVDAGEPRNRFAPHMHGVLGHDGRSPLDLLAAGRGEVQGYGVVLRHGVARDVSRDGAVLRVDGETARALVVATGARDELPPIDGLAELWGTDAVACPYCDGYESRDSRIGVVHGPHQAQLLTQWSSDVTLFTDGEPVELGGFDAIAVDARRIRGVRRAVSASGGDDEVEVVVDGGAAVVDRLFVATRFVPRDDVLVALDAERHEVRGISVAVVDGSGATSVPGVWAVGNVVDPAALVPVAMGQGVAAAASVNAALTFGR